jgi:LEA14-like dessication related protein
MPRMRARTLFAVAVLTLASGCRHVEDTGRLHAKFTTEELTFLDQNLQGGLLRFFARLSGPAHATATRVIWDIQLDGKSLDRGETPIDRAFGADGSISFELIQRITYAHDAEELRTLSQKKGPRRITVKGEVRLEMGSKTGEEAYARVLDVATPRLPEAQLVKAEGARFSDGSVQVAFEIAVKNPNPFPLLLQEAPYSGLLGGKAIDEGTLGAGQVLDANGSARFPIAASLDPDEEAAARAAHKSSVKFELRGALRGELFKVPFDLSGEVPLRKGN